MKALFLIMTALLASANHYQDVPVSFFSLVPLIVLFTAKFQCLWKNGKNQFDLRPLTLPSSKNSYYIKDGDIPCTPETEPSFSYEWNFCANVSPVPKPCARMGKSSGVAMQYVELADGFYDCYIIGRYDPKHDDLFYSLLDPNDPSKGVSIKYPDGEKCTVGASSGQITKLRSATIDVMCENVPLKVVSAQEPEECGYHIVMKSFHGCPTVRSSLLL